MTYHIRIVLFRVKKQQQNQNSVNNKFEAADPVSPRAKEKFSVRPLKQSAFSGEADWKASSQTDTNPKDKDGHILPVQYPLYKCPHSGIFLDAKQLVILI